jgi:hypothetical protein
MTIDKQLIKKMYRFSQGRCATSAGLGILQGRYFLKNPELAAEIKALSVVYLREHFQQHRTSSYAEFDEKIQRRNLESQIMYGRDETMNIVFKNMDFSSEERGIRSQVQKGQRCADCLKPFNAGERKQIKAGSGSIICQRCYANESHHAMPGEEVAV